MTISNANYKPYSKHDLLRVCTGKYEQDPLIYFKAFEPQPRKKNCGFFPGFYAKKSRLNPKLTGQKPDSIWTAKMSFVKQMSNNFSSPGKPLEDKSRYPILTNTLSYLEKVASDFYDVLSQDKYLVPKTKLALLSILNEHIKNSPHFRELDTGLPKSQEIKELVFMLSKDVANYIPLGKAYAISPNGYVNIKDYAMTMGRPPEEIIYNNQSMPLVGLMEVLAVARILNDFDVTGVGFTNIGFVIETSPVGRKIARIVKIDPGPSLNNNIASRLDDPRDIKYSIRGDVFRWKKLTEKQKVEFLDALSYNINTLTKDNELLEFLFHREGRFEPLFRNGETQTNFGQARIDFIKKVLFELEVTYQNDDKDLASNKDMTSLPSISKIQREISVNGQKTTNSSCQANQKLQADSKIKAILHDWASGNSLEFKLKLFIDHESIADKFEAILNIEQCSLIKTPILDLSDKQIKSFPEGIYEHLTHVEKINLENTGISCLPDGIDKLENLTCLNLKNNPIKDYLALYQQLKPLQQCKIELSNEQKKEYYNAILNAWVYPVNWTNIDHWRDKGLAIRKEAAARILSCLLEDKEELDLSYLDLHSFPIDLIKECKNLKLLSLHYCKLATLPEHITKLTNLKELNLSENNLTTLPESFGQLINLESLNISLNKLISLPKSFGQLSNLKRLDIFGNNLTTLPNSFTQLTNLKDLYIQRNSLTTLPEYFGQLINLARLDISLNNLTRLPESFDQLSNLKWLDISFNKLTTLPESFNQLYNLEKLDIFGNNLTALPETFGQLTNLKKLYIQRNNLTALPESFGQLINLEKLYISKCELKALPESLGQLTNLKELYISGNYLTKLPESFTQLTNLRILNFSANISPIVPNSIKETAEIYFD